MSRIKKPLFFVFLSLFFIALQSSVLSPARVGTLSPDLNLILIVYLGLYSESRSDVAIAFGNGILMDAFSGLPLGMHTLSRASAFLLMKGVSDSFYFKNLITHAFFLFLATIYTWSFIWAAFIISGRNDAEIALSGVGTQAVVNTVLGVALFSLIGKVDARL